MHARPPARPAPAAHRHAPAIVNQALHGSGAPLDAGTQALMERRFQHDFADVRVHTDDRAAASARAIHALAYTVGRSIVFDHGRFAPHEPDGSRLLAHELVHTIQQSRTPRPPDGKRLPVESPASAHEDQARSIAAAPGALLRAPTIVENAVVQRAISTDGGEWDTDNYNAVQDVDVSGAAVPAAQGMRGADIALRFKPNFSVNAERIGLTQTVQSFVAGALAPTPAAATRAIPAADAKPLNTGAGETDVGTAIDRASGYNNPIYPVQTAPSASLSDPNTAASWGQLGWQYADAAGARQKQDATLIDHPRRAGAQKNSRQVFETAALATKGAQDGWYYGSVRWGWRTDDAGALTKVDLQKVSDQVPSSSFQAAAAIWNRGVSSTGAANVMLTMVDVMVTTAPITLIPDSVVRLPIPLPAGTRVKVLRGFGAPPWLPDAGRLQVVDGPSAGITGDVNSTGAATTPLAPERS
jgi:uncharacterized protein DUF4157